MNDTSLNRMMEYSFDRINRKPDSKLTVTEICLDLHISRSTFYECFDNIQGLYDSLFDSLVEEAKKTLLFGVDFSSSNLRNKVELFVRSLLTFLGEHRNHSRALFMFYGEMYPLKIKKICSDFFDFDPTSEAYFAYRFLLGGFSYVIGSWIMEGGMRNRQGCEKELSDQLYLFLKDYGIPEKKK